WTCVLARQDLLERRRIIALQQGGEADQFLGVEYMTTMPGRLQWLGRQSRTPLPPRPALLHWRAFTPGAQLVAHPVAVAQGTTAGQRLGDALLAHAAGCRALATRAARRRVRPRAGKRLRTG